MDFVASLDLWLFTFMNMTISIPQFDPFFRWLTEFNKNPANLIFLLFGLLYLIILQPRRGITFLLSFALLLTLTDQVNSVVLKGLFERARPCHTLTEIRLLVPCGPGYSFPSSHAVNAFASAVLLSAFWPRLKIIFYTIAFLLALSRVVVGVHYPFDVIAGGVIGFLVGMTYLWLLSKSPFEKWIVPEVTRRIGMGK